ncbi:baseplate megatron protein TIM-barrel domain-containing protein, partial [Roseicyclus sp.]|uniref:phage tail protein n=1 Tax=Roseicyclus sp. TaxID=1914329 RepID=UPI003FA138AB
MERAFLDGLSDNAMAALAWLFEFWALPHQQPPDGDWRTWLVLGGRGAGKTRAGAEWVRAQVEGPTPEDKGKARHVALVAETYDQALAVMVKGQSGILACSPPDRRPRWVAGERLLIWPNGAEGRVFSAHDAEALRGPQFDLAWADEFGCAAIDRGTNQPNVFLDPKSDESALPHFSSGRRDDAIQAQYLRAVLDYWSDLERNPVSEVYGGPMLDMDRAHAWAWDARPWPAFPHDAARWADGGNWTRGHWLTGRLDAAPLDLVVAEICERAGVSHYDVSRLHGLVRGHLAGETDTARAALQPLMLAHGFDAVERDGRLVFRPLPLRPEAVLTEEATAIDEGGQGGFTRIRAPEAETVGRLRIAYADGEASHDARVAEATHPGDASDLVSETALPLALTPPEATAIAERRLAEARVARDALKLSLPPSSRALGAGSLIALEDGTTWRIDRVTDRGARDVEAVRVEPSTAEPSDEAADPATHQPFVPPLPVTPIFLDLPLLTGAEVPHAPHLAVAAAPWPGAVAVYRAPGPDGFELDSIVERGAVAGVLETPLFAAPAGLWDRGAPMRVRLA